MGNSTRFFGKVFPRSSLIKNYNVTVDAGLIDSDYRGLIYFLLSNHSKKAFTIRAGDRIAQVVFLENLMCSLRKLTKKKIKATQKEETVVLVPQVLQ